RPARRRGGAYLRGPARRSWCQPARRPALCAHVPRRSLAAPGPASRESSNAAHPAAGCRTIRAALRLRTPATCPPGSRGGQAELGHAAADVLAAAREVAKDLAIEPADLRQAVLDGFPLDADARCQAVAQCGLIEEARGPGVSVKRPAVERAPVIGGACRVRDD